MTNDKPATDEAALADEIIAAVKADDDCRGRSKFEVMQILARHRARVSDGREVLAKVVHRNGPVVIDFMGEDLAWRPLDYGAWTPLATLSPDDKLRVMALTDDPDWICAGIPDEAIEAGIEVFRRIEHDSENYRPGETPDWDEGMQVAAIFKAVARAALGDTA